MFWYCVICCLMSFPLCLVYVGRHTDRNANHIALIIACEILWFFMAFRSKSVGVDTKYYCSIFSQFRDIPLAKTFVAPTYAVWDKSWAMDFEPGYRLFNKILSYFSNKEQMITIANSTVILALLYRFIKRSSPNYLLSIWLYITLGIFQTEINVARNAIAILIVYNALEYAKSKKFWRYCLWCLVGASIHISALAFIPVYFLLNINKLSVKKCVAMVAIFALLGVLFSKYSTSFAMILPARMRKYLGGDGEKIEKIAVGMVNVGLVCITYWFMSKAERKNVFEVCHSGIVLVLLKLCSFGVSLGSGFAARIAALFGPYIIVFLPQMIKQIRSDRRRSIVIMLITVFAGIQYVLRLCVNNIGGTMPYCFFWQ